MSGNNQLPSLEIPGSVSIASGFPRSITQNSFIFSDDLSLVQRSHTLRFGGSITRLQDDVDLIGLGSLVRFLSWPDFLLGLSAASNGTGFSNVFASFDDFGLSTREYRVWEGTGFAQDDYRVLKSLALNVGVRYERLGNLPTILVEMRVSTLLRLISTLPWPAALRVTSLLLTSQASSRRA